jgi:hypothetical protein
VKRPRDLGAWILFDALAAVAAPGGPLTPILDPFDNRGAIAKRNDVSDVNHIVTPHGELVCLVTDDDRVDEARHEGIIALLDKHVGSASPLREPFAPLHVLLEERGAELLEAGGRILERPQDQLAIDDLQREHASLAVRGVGELRASFVKVGSSTRATSWSTRARGMGRPARVIVCGGRSRQVFAIMVGSFDRRDC